MKRHDPENKEVIKQSYSLYLNDMLVGHSGLYRDLPGHDKPMAHDRRGGDMMGLDHYLQQNGMDNYTLEQQAGDIVVRTSDTSVQGIHQYLTEFLTHHPNLVW